MATVIKNLGRVSGLVPKLTAPVNTDVLWKNLADGGKIYYYNTTLGTWVLLGSDGASDIYAGASPANINLGGIPSGYVMTGKSKQQILQDLLVTYLLPAFSAFTVVGQTVVLEVSDSVSGAKTITWATTNSTNIDAGIGISLRDVTSGNVSLATGLANDGTEGSIAFGTITKTSPSTHIWRISGTNSNGGVFTRDFTVEWRYRVYSGTSASISLNEAGIEALAASSLAASKNGTYSFAAGNYKYFAWPTDLGSPTAATGFRDTATNLAVDMADSTDDAFFNQSQNGWSYGLVSVTNAFGQVISYRVYRTKNSLGGSINIAVS